MSHCEILGVRGLPPVDRIASPRPQVDEVVLVEGFGGEAQSYLRSEAQTTRRILLTLATGRVRVNI